MQNANFEHFFRPRSMAIVGASAETETLSGQPLKHLLSHGFQGRVYPVNPKYREILGVKCYASLEELPESPDVVQLLVNSARIPEMLRQCGRMQVPFAIVFGSGFAETGADGTRAQQELAAIARETGVRVLGPNCQGMVNIGDGVYTGFGSVFGLQYPVGGLSMVSQSGGFGFCVMNLASMDEGLHFQKVITTGNEADLSSLDFVDRLIDDPPTRMIAMYVEGMKDGHRLVEIASRALDRRKPIMAWKAGVTEAGRNAVASHTASLAGEATLYQAVFRQCGIIQVEDLQDLVDYSKALACGRLPAGNRVAIITVSGGSGILATDACAAGGMVVPPLADTTVASLRDILPSFGSVRNPIDVTASILHDWTLVNRTLDAVLRDPGIDAIIMVNTSLQGELAAKVAGAIVSVAAKADKPIFCTWSARDDVAGEAYALLDAAGIPRYKSPVRCGRALAVLSRYAETLRRHEAAKAEPAPLLSSPEARQELARRPGIQTEYTSKRILAGYGIRTTSEVLASSLHDAHAAAEALGFPVALKVQSPDIPHKTEAKAIRLGLNTSQEVALAYDTVMGNALNYRPDARIDGVLVQQMVAEGIETIVGVSNDASFGPVVMFGLGGIFAEVLKDVSFRIAPVNRSEALEMIREIKGYPLLAGARGRPVADIEALACAIVRVSALAVDLRDQVAELDINPLFVFERGQGVKAGDALIRTFDLQ